MSGYVPKRVANTKTAIGSTDQKPAGSSIVMLGLESTIGRRRPIMRMIQKKAYASMQQKECKDGNTSKCN